MIGADLEQLFARPLAQPVSEARMQIGSGGLRKTRVRHLADQNVLEAVRGLARDRRSQLGDEEFPQQQRLEHGLELFELRCQLLDRPAPERTADHRGVLEHRLLFRRQPVDAGRDQRLERVGDPLGELGERSPLAFSEHAYRLLDEERVALGFVQQSLAGLTPDHPV